jgi:uncharacterized protein YjbI with pentapeptide repeats
MAIGPDGTGEVKGYYIGPGADLQGADLEGADLYRANLEGANLVGANLYGANLFRAKLERADLEKATLNKADLVAADLRGANLKEAKLDRAQLMLAHLKDANLNKANLSNADLSGAILLGADLSGATLTETKLEDAQLKGAIFSGAHIILMDMPGVDLSGSDFSGAFINAVDLNSANLSGANLAGAKLAYVTLNQANLSGANLSATAMTNVQLCGANLTNKAVLDRAEILLSDLDSSDFTGASLVKAKLSPKVNMDGANLSGADLTGADLQGASLLRIILDKETKLKGTDLRYTNLKLENLNEIDLRKAKKPQDGQAIKSFGTRAGPILKMLKPDSPKDPKAFKLKYPVEFEFLAQDAGGQAFTDSIQQKIVDKYCTPFHWFVTYDSKWKDKAQRRSQKPNSILLLNLYLGGSDIYVSDSQIEILGKIDDGLNKNHVSRHPRIPFWPAFTIGWVRYALDDEHKVILIEEIQSDIAVIELMEKRDPGFMAKKFSISQEEYAEVKPILDMAKDRFFEDAIGIMYQTAVDWGGYTVEMLDYADKGGKDYFDDVEEREIRPPKSLYTDLPRRMLMREKRISAVKTRVPLKGKVSYYKPNPGIPPRYRQECCICDQPASLMSDRGDVFCEDCF